MRQPIVVSAPASVMLFGEHAVLRGGVAIAAAVDCRLTVALTPRDDRVIELCSSLGSADTTVEERSLGPKFRFAEACLRAFDLPQGLSIHVASEISTTVGLASSASVTVALLSALHTWLGLERNDSSILRMACQVIRAVQGYGSGADAASILSGGVIAYRAEDYSVTPLTRTLPLILAYSGRKTPTPEVIRYVNDLEASRPEIYRSLFSSIDTISERAVEAVASNSLKEVGQLMDHAQGLMEALGVSTPELSALCWQMRSIPSIYGAKISGSGLGDAVVALGEGASHSLHLLPSRVATEGVRYE